MAPRTEESGSGRKAPPSTFISSPLRGTARRRKAQAQRESLIIDKEDDDESDDDVTASPPLHANGYENDGFVVGERSRTTLLSRCGALLRRPGAFSGPLTNWGRQSLGMPVSRGSRAERDPSGHSSRTSSNGPSVGRKSLESKEHAKDLIHRPAVPRDGYSMDHHCDQDAVHPGIAT